MLFRSVIVDCRIKFNSATNKQLGAYAEVAEWSNAHDSKSCYVGIRTEVRILSSAPKNSDSLSIRIFLYIIIYVWLSIIV